jgi:hypothetical protein
MRLNWDSRLISNKKSLKYNQCKKLNLEIEEMAMHNVKVEIQKL